MTITATSGVSGVLAVGADISSAARRPKGASGFSVASPEAAVPLSSSDAAACLRDVGALLALQEDASDGAGSRRAAEREARRHGRDLLRALSDLQRALLGAGGLPACLDHLDTLIRSAPGEIPDPGLAQAVRAIRLRAELELHRLRGSSAATGSAGWSPP